MCIRDSYNIWDKSWPKEILHTLSQSPNFFKVPYYENGKHKIGWKMLSNICHITNHTNTTNTVIPRSMENNQDILMSRSPSARLSNDHHMINLNEKRLKDISTPQLTSEISRIVTTLSVAEEMRVVDALDTSGISFDNEETVLKQEVGIKEEQEIKPNLSVEAGPSKDSDFTSDITVKNTQNVDLYKCHVCNKHFNQYDLELHFVTDHMDEEIF